MKKGWIILLCIKEEWYVKDEKTYGNCIEDAKIFRTRKEAREIKRENERIRKVKITTEIVSGR